MTKKTETVIKKYKALSEKEKYDFLKSLDENYDKAYQEYTEWMEVD